MPFGHVWVTAAVHVPYAVASWAGDVSSPSAHHRCHPTQSAGKGKVLKVFILSLDQEATKPSKDTEELTR